MRLQDKVAIVVGAGQSPGEGIGNGRATALTFAREGAKVVCVDHDLNSAQETVDMIGAEPGHRRRLQGRRHQGTPTSRRWSPTRMPAGAASTSCTTMSACRCRAATPSSIEITEEAFDRCVAINLKSCILAAKHVHPDHARAEERRDHQHLVDGGDHDLSVRRLQGDQGGDGRPSPSSSPTRTRQYGIRANVILPGLMNTPMAVDTRAREFSKTRAEIEAMRDAQVPLRKKMGTGWDVANAALFLASDEANFITGVTLPVDGGASVRRG